MSKTDDSKLSGKEEVDLKGIVSQTNDWLYDARKMCGDAQQVAINTIMDDPGSSYSALVDINERLDKITHELWKIGIRLELVDYLL